MSAPATLCLDFANTVSWRASDQPEEKLTSYADLVAWARKAGVLVPAEARRLVERAESSPAAAAGVLSRAIAWREAIYRIVAGLAEDGQAHTADVALLNRALRETLARLGLVQSREGLRWEWHGEPDALDRMLWPVVRSAADLLTSPDVAKVRACAGQGCGWLFLDRSRNHSRRWCDMSDCGNREKARRHYERLRQARTY